MPREWIWPVLRIETTFPVPVWDEAARQRAIAYWSGQGMVFSEISEGRLIGRRGTLRGNLLSYDMTRLMAEVLILASPEHEVYCLLKVDTVGQILLPHERASFGLEMQRFEECVCQVAFELEAAEPPAGRGNELEAADCQHDQEPVDPDPEGPRG